MEFLTRLVEAFPALPWIPAIILGFVLMAEFINTAEITTNRIIINYLALLPVDEIRFTEIVSMRLAKGPFDDWTPGLRYGGALFSPRLIIKLSRRRWLTKTAHLKARNARRIIAAFNAYSGA